MTPLSSDNGFLGPFLPQSHSSTSLLQSSGQTYHSNGSISAFQLPLLAMCVCAWASVCTCTGMCVCARRPEVTLVCPPCIALNFVSFWFEIYFSLVNICLSVCVCALCVCRHLQMQKIPGSRVAGLWVLPDVGAGNQTWFLKKGSEYS